MGKTVSKCLRLTDGLPKLTRDILSPREMPQAHKRQSIGSTRVSFGEGLHSSVYVPGEFAVMIMQIGKSTKFARDTTRQAGVYTAVCVIVIHVLKSRGWRRFSEIYVFERPIAAPNEPNTEG